MKPNLSDISKNCVNETEMQFNDLIYLRLE